MFELPPRRSVLFCKKNTFFEPPVNGVCVCVFFSCGSLKKKYMLGKGPAKIAQRCRVGIESPNVRGWLGCPISSKTLKYLGYMKPFSVSVSQDGWETTFFVLWFFAYFQDLQYMGFRVGMGTPTFPPQKRTLLPWSHLSFSQLKCWKWWFRRDILTKI